MLSCWWCHKAVGNHSGCPHSLRQPSSAAWYRRCTVPLGSRWSTSENRETLGVLRGPQAQLQTSFTDIILSIRNSGLNSVRKKNKTRNVFQRSPGETTAVAKQHLNKTCFLHFNQNTFRHNGKKPQRTVMFAARSLQSTGYYTACTTPMVPDCLKLWGILLS